MTLHKVVVGSAVVLVAAVLAAGERAALSARAAQRTAGAATAPAAPRAARTAYDTADTTAWRADTEAKLKAPEGWLSVAGLHFLKPGENSVGGDPASDVPLPADAAPKKVGRIQVEGTHVWFEPEPGAAVTADGKPVTTRIDLEGGAPAAKAADATAATSAAAPAAGSGAAGARRAGPVRLIVGNRVIVHLHHSGDRLAVRLRDPESKIRREFTGLRWFKVDPAWSVTGKWIPFAEPRPVQIQNVLGDELNLKSPGEVEAVIAGKTVKLLALTEGPGDLWFIFTDPTAPKETYRIRYLHTTLAEGAAAGTPVTLDFNRAYNPPCAYNPFTTCPLPPPQNRLTTRVPAGERAYHAES